MSPLRTIHVGENSALVAIDAHDHHVFVANEAPLAADRVMPSRSGSVAMVDEGSGAVLRTVTVGQSPVAIAFDAPTKRVFVLAAGRIDTSAGFTSGRGSVSVLDATTGAVVRTLKVGSVPLTALGSGAVPSARQALAVDSTSGRVYVAAADTLLALDGSTGTIRQTLELSTGASPQTLSPSTVAVSARVDRLYVGDGYDANGPPPATLLGSSSGSLAVVDSAATRGVANVVLGQEGVGAIAVDTRAGRVLVVEPRGASERVIVDVLAARTGVCLRTLTLPDAVGGGNAAVALDRARSHAFVVYTPSGYEAENGFGATLYVLDTASGRVLQEAPLMSGTNDTSGGAGYFLSNTVTMVERPARVLVATARGGLSELPGSVAVYSSGINVFDAPSGRFLATLPVGVGPQDVAIDETTHRIFVTNEHDNTLSIFDATRL